MSWIETVFRKPVPSRTSGLRLLFAALALWVQMVAGGVALPHAMPDSLDDAIAASICHADPAEAPTPQRNHTPDCALCPVCQIAAQAQLILPPLTPSFTAQFAITRAIFSAHPTQIATRLAQAPARARGPPITA
jgi:hypothetical protein